MHYHYAHSKLLKYSYHLRFFTFCYATSTKFIIFNVTEQYKVVNSCEVDKKVKYRFTLMPINNIQCKQLPGKTVMVQLQTYQDTVVHLN